jgi:tetratricopeptide (TPR) repeat protein
MLLAELGKLSEAEQAFRAAFKADPRSAQAAYNLGILLSKDRPDEALTWSRRAADLRPENPQYGYTYAFYLYRAGKLKEALEALRQVRQHHPTHEDAAALERQLLQQQSSKPASAQPP